MTTDTNRTSSMPVLPEGGLGPGGSDIHELLIIVARQFLKSNGARDLTRRKLAALASVDPLVVSMNFSDRATLIQSIQAQDLAA